MRFLISRASQGAVSKQAPCPGALRGAEAKAWPGEYQWYLELESLAALTALVEQVGGGLGVFSPEEDEEHPMLQILDEDELG